jgi:nidogen (entactin)
MVGVFVPACEANGDYSPQQFYGSTGFSWCVDPEGNKIPGTETPPWENPVDCSTFEPLFPE